MLSLLQNHQSSYPNPDSPPRSYTQQQTLIAPQNTSSNTLTLCNPPSWGSLHGYPSPPMSRSETSTPRFPSHLDGSLDQSYPRFRPQVNTQDLSTLWQQPPSYSYPQQRHSDQSINAYQPSPRSPRSAFVQTSYLNPLPLVNNTYPPLPPQPQPSFYHVPAPPPSSILTSSNTKVPKTQRRTKQHVQSACSNCKKAHLSCDVARPCNRCTQSGKTDTCHDVEHKKRGRPRLRDEHGVKIVRPDRGTASATSTIKTASTAGTLRRGSDNSYRVLKSHHDGSGRPTIMEFAARSSYDFPRALDAKALSGPVAFLNLDLTIIQTNAVFASVFSFEGEPRGRPLEYLVDPKDRGILLDVRRGLTEEKLARELPPIRGAGAPGNEAIPPVETIDLVGLVSQGYQERSAQLNFRFGGGFTQSLAASLRLARTDVFFAVLVLPPLPEPAQALFAAPQPRIQRPITPSYSFGSSYPSAVPNSSAPPSPYYTLGSGQPPMPIQTPPAMLKQSYDQSGYFFPQQQQVAASHGGSASFEPRQLPAYAIDMQYQPQQQHAPQHAHHHQQQLLQPQANYQLPPLSNGTGYPDQQPRARTAMAGQGTLYGHSGQELGRIVEEGEDGAGGRGGRGGRKLGLRELAE